HGTWTRCGSTPPPALRPAPGRSPLRGPRPSRPRSRSPPCLPRAPRSDPPREAGSLRWDRASARPATCADLLEQMLAAVSEQESCDEALGEPPRSAHACEAVDVVARRDRLEWKRVRLLEDRHVAARARAIAVELDGDVGDEVLRARRAVGVEPRDSEELPHLRGAVSRHELRPALAADAIRRMLEQRRRLRQATRVDVLGIGHEQRLDRMPILERAHLRAEAVEHPARALDAARDRGPVSLGFDPGTEDLE